VIMAKPKIVEPAMAGRKRVNQWTESLRTSLTQEEKWDLAMANATAVCDYQRVELEKKAATKAYGIALKELRKQVDEGSRALRAGTADRDVGVEEWYDLADDRVRRVRMDTGETILERLPTEAERQQAFEFGAPS